PYFEAEEVGFAHQEPQQSDWVPYYEAEEVGHSPRARREQASEEPRQSGWLPYYEAAEVGNTPRDHRENATEESQESGWVLPSLPFAAFAGFASAAAWSSSPADATTEEDLPSSEAAVAADAPQEGLSLSFASFSLPFAAFAGYGDEAAASTPKAKAPPKPKPPAPKSPVAKPPKPAKPKSTASRKDGKIDQEVQKMAQVGWQPWATYAAEDNEEPGNPESIVLPLRPPH
ncbi:unnamed protein product, partial [Symbiodinium necroappetens]